MPTTDHAARVADELLAGRDGQLRVVAAMGPQQPDQLLNALVTAARRLNIELTLLVADLSGRLAFLDERGVSDLRAGRVHVISLAGAVPPALAATVDYVALSLWDIDRMLASGRLAADVAVARVAETDDPDLVSFGDMVGYTPSAFAQAQYVGLEVAPGRTFPGTGCIRVDSATAQYQTGVAEARPPRPRRPAGDARQAIARAAADLIPDGATIELGLGAVPSSITAALSTKRDLGIHSGIMTVELRELLGTHVVTGAHKETYTGAHVATGVLEDDPTSAIDAWGESVKLHAVSVTHAPETLRAYRSFWAVNSAHEIDLSAQINAEFVSGRRITSGGGQSDFMRAAHASPDGASIIALPSRDRHGRPRILHQLDCPHVTATGADLDFVVTEYGIADLRDTTAAERAKRLTAIAHPADREELRVAWRKAGG